MRHFNMSWLAIISLLLFVFSFSLKTDFSFDQDLGRHLKLGQLIWQTKSIPHINLFTYTYPNFPFIDHHWLFELISFAASSFLSIKFLFWFKIVLLLVTCYLLLLLCKKSWLLLPLGFLFFHILRERVDFRPELFSFLFTDLTIFILQKYEQSKSKLIYLLPIIELFWVNIHIYFLIGLGILGAFWLNQLRWERPWRLRELDLIIIFSTLFTLFNPNFLSGVIYPIKIFSNYGYTVAENQNIFLLESIKFTDANFLFVKLTILLIFISWIYGLKNKTLNFLNFILPLTGIVLALLNIRSFPYLVFLGLPAVLELLAPLGQKKWAQGLAFFCLILLSLEGILYLNNSYYLYTDQQTRAGAFLTADYQPGIDFLLSNKLPGPIFNNFDMGSFLEYKTFPRYKSFVDGRPEVYPASFFQQVYIPMQQKEEVFSNQLKKYGFGTIVFSITDQTPWAANFFNFITKNKDWKVVYLDDYMIILVKRDLAANLAEINLDSLPLDFIKSTDNMAYLRLAFFLYESGHPKAAYEFTQKSLQLFPYSPQANKLASTILQRSGDTFGLAASQYYQNSSNFYFW